MKTNTVHADGYVQTTCPICGEEIRIMRGRTSLWQFKRNVKKGKESAVYYFDNYECMNRFNEEWKRKIDKERSIKRKRALRERQKKRRQERE